MPWLTVMMSALSATSAPRRGSWSNMGSAPWPWPRSLARIVMKWPKVMPVRSSMRAFMCFLHPQRLCASVAIRPK